MKPLIVCLCGSTRFSEAYQRANLTETLAGKIVLTIGCNMRSDANLFENLSGDKLTKIKTDLDELHKRKIDLADEILVIDVGGYVGDSTREEIVYAASCGKRIRYWSEREKLCPICSQSLERHEMPITERDTGGKIADCILWQCPECDYFDDESTRENFGRF